MYTYVYMFMTHMWCKVGLHCLPAMLRYIYARINMYFQHPQDTQHARSKLASDGPACKLLTRGR